MMIGYSPCLKFGIVGGTFKSVETYGAEMGVDMFPKELFSKSFLRIIIICRIIFFVLLPKTAVSLLQLNYLISQQCCDSENESGNKRVKSTVAIV